LDLHGNAILGHKVPGHFRKYGSPFTIGPDQQLSGRVLSLGGWSPLIHTGYHVPGATWEQSRETSAVCLRGYYPLWLAFPGIFDWAGVL